MSDFFPDSGDWVGPPVLVLKLLTEPGERILDGRKRLEEHARRRLRYEPPRLVVKSHLMALKMLVQNGHQDRAAEHALVHAPEFADKTTAYLIHAFDTTHQKLIPYLQALQPENQHKLPRRAMAVVKRAKLLENEMRETGRKATLADITNVLGEFIK